MKKLIMIFFILGSVSFAATTSTTTTTTAAPVNMGQSLVSVMMPTSISTSTHPTTQAPMDVVSGVVTTAYGAK
ncbi:hypothetical protein [Fusobacterium sp. MFO224]|uniref:hypothetical protein n=1 Tax=Fusobacterium sp. MFO224 TaxID=3378070 RepID=UPI0038539419